MSDAGQRMMTITRVVDADGIDWDRYDYEHGETIYQRECAGCDRGLLLAPVRFCPCCDGTGYIVRRGDTDE